ncbi:hypothetical protein ACFL6E_03465 [Candidatus Neomarinimicrobiota bacterium]
MKEMVRIRGMLSLYRSLGKADLKNIRRDDLLAWIWFLPIVLAVALRFLVPWLQQLLSDQFAFNLTPYYDLIASFFMSLSPMMSGMVVGFLLLDERDDQTLSALLVTPMPLAAYLSYRISVPLALGFLITVAAYPLTGLPDVPFRDLIIVGAVASFNGPITALVLATFAENKVTGFAMIKILNSVNIIPVAAYFFDEPLQLLAGFVPVYWTMKITWLAVAEADYALYAVAGILANALLLWLLLKAFARVMRR